jgi:hypothetical protein
MIVDITQEVINDRKIAIPLFNRQMAKQIPTERLVMDERHRNGKTNRCECRTIFKCRFFDPTKPRTRLKRNCAQHRTGTETKLGKNFNGRRNADPGKLRATSKCRFANEPQTRWLLKSNMAKQPTVFEAIIWKINHVDGNTAPLVEREVAKPQSTNHSGTKDENSAPGPN